MNTVSFLKTFFFWFFVLFDVYLFFQGIFTLHRTDVGYSSDALEASFFVSFGILYIIQSKRMKTLQERINAFDHQDDVLPTIIPVKP